MTGYLIAGTAAAVLLLCIRHAARQVGIVALAWRWLSGHTWHGKPHTDATWLHPATRVLHPSGHASRFHHLPRAHRAGLRLAVTIAAAGAPLGLWLDRPLTLATLAAAGFLAAVGGTVATVRAVRTWQHHRAWVRPLHVALAPALGVPLATRPKSWLTVPRDFAHNEGAAIRVDLPERFIGSADAKRLVVEAVQSKLGLEDVRPAFHLTGSPYLSLTTSIPPPDRVTLADVAGMLPGLPETAPLIGLGRKSVPVSFDLAADSPHLLVSGGSGSGKSVLARFIMAQGMRNGGIFLVLDVKRISHRWAKGLPNVHYCRSIAEIHEALIWCQSEIDRRNDIVDEYSDDDGELPPTVDIGPRFWLVCEEMNATANRLGAYWRKIKPQDAPATSPAVEALNDFLFMGRAVKMHAVAIAQMMTARTLGGPEARENFAFRCLARYSVNAWRMLCPEVWPMPRMSRHTGRWQVVTGGQAREVQVGFMKAAEARAWATSGTVAAFPDMDAPQTLRTARTLDIEPVAATASVSLVGEPGDRAVGLSEACEGGIVSVGLAALRSARARDPEFPRPCGKRGAEMLYSGHALAAWQDNRPMARAEGE